MNRSEWLNDLLLPRYSRARDYRIPQKSTLRYHWSPSPLKPGFES